MALTDPGLDGRFAVMQPPKPPEPAKSQPALTKRSELERDARRSREAAALRENLRRRKQQAPKPDERNTD